MHPSWKKKEFEKDISSLACTGHLGCYESQSSCRKVLSSLKINKIKFSTINDILGSGQTLPSSFAGCVLSISKSLFFFFFLAVK